MSIFSKLKQFKELRDQAKKIENVLGQEKVEVTGASGMIKITLNGKQEVISLSIDPSLLQPLQKERLERGLTATFNDAVHKVQKLMAGKIQDLGGLNLPQLKW